MPVQAGLAFRVVSLFLAIALGSGCATNIAHVPKSAAAVPSFVVFSASQDRVWSAAQAALATGPAFKVLDKAAATLITEFKTVDAKELSFARVVLLGKTYKTNYTVNLRALGPDRTEVTVSVGVQSQQVGVLVRDEDNPELQGFMRQKLFDQLAAILRA